MGGYQTFYTGSDYGFDSKAPSGPLYNNFSGYSNVPISDIGFTHDPRTSNLLKSVSDKLNTGAKTVEVQGIQMEQLDYVPKQQWKEIYRLKKLTGVDLTFHGPLVEATGVTRQGWDETQRMQAEEEMYSAIERAQVMDPDGNLVVTFHSSNGLPDPEVKQKVFNPETGKHEQVVTGIMVIDSRTGQLSNVGPPARDYFKEGEKAPLEDIEKKLNEQNKEAWSKQLQSVSFHANNGHSIVAKTLGEADEEELEYRKLTRETLLNHYKNVVKNPEVAQKQISGYSQKKQNVLQKLTDDIIHGDVYLRDAYLDLQKLYNQAYEAAKRDKREKDLKILQEYQKKVSKPVQEIIDDPSRIIELGRIVVDGVNTLRTIEAPQILQPMRKWAIDKASDTFSNVAYRGYKKFKENAPVVSVENPPAGMGLHRGQDLRELIDKSREKFEQKAMQDGMSKDQARKHSEKLLGVTWDVGHINMIRKFGYSEKDVIGETKKIADLVKHVHLSDNFGLQHTELPMGMGNVPTKQHLELIQKFAKQKEKIKKIVETGGWYQHFKVTPFRETMEAFGSPLYATMAPTFLHQGEAPYFAGRGLNPDVHHSIYGAGFSSLPIELGGQIQGGVNRMSGRPLS